MLHDARHMIDAVVTDTAVGVPNVFAGILATLARLSQVPLK